MAGCEGGVMDSVSETEIGESSWNSSRVSYIHLRANILVKVMKPYPPFMGKIVGLLSRKNIGILKKMLMPY